MDDQAEYVRISRSVSSINKRARSIVEIAGAFGGNRIDLHIQNRIFFEGIGVFQQGIGKEAVKIERVCQRSDRVIEIASWIGKIKVRRFSNDGDDGSLLVENAWAGAVKDPVQGDGEPGSIF